MLRDAPSYMQCRSRVGAAVADGSPIGPWVEKPVAARCPIRWFLQPEPLPRPPGESHAQGRGMEHFVGIDVARDRLDRGLCGRAVRPLPSCADGKGLGSWGSGPESPRCRIDRVWNTVAPAAASGRHPLRGANVSGGLPRRSCLSIGCARFRRESGDKPQSNRRPPTSRPICLLDQPTL